MTSLVVARKDFRDAVRARSLWALTALLVVLGAVMAYAFQVVQEQGAQQGGAVEVAAVDYVFFALSALVLVLPVTAVVVCYKAIAGEAESGSLKLLLSLPHERRDVVLGKWIGRTLVVSVAAVVGFLTSAVVGAILFDQFSPLAYLVFLALTVVYVGAYVAVIVGISATTTSSSRAATGAVGVFLVFELLWDVVPVGLYYLVEGGFPGPTANPLWYRFLNILPPSGAYVQAVGGLLSPDSATGVALGTATDSALLSWWFAIILLLLWTAVPLGLGYLRFRSLDL